MSDLEKWRKKVQENSITDKAKILDYMMSHAVVEDEPFRLEILYRPEGELVIIQGNLKGLKSLQEALERLIESSPVGGHIHYDSSSGLSKSEIPLIIQKVGDTGVGPHVTDMGSTIE